MKIDGEQLNYINNKLKTLVGEQGGFILMAVKPDGEVEDFQIRTFGPDIRLVGLLTVSAEYLEKFLKKKFDGRIQQLPAEPD